MDEEQHVKAQRPKDGIRHFFDTPTEGYSKYSIGSHSISPSSMVRNLGIIMDRRLSMVNQVHQVAKVCNFRIRLIGKIRKYLTEDSCQALASSLVISRLDYGNSLLHGIAVRQITRLQRCSSGVQVRRREHITPTLMYLHWLPVSYRVMFKVMIFAFKALHGLGPKYLQELVTPPSNLSSPSVAEQTVGRSTRCSNRDLWSQNIWLCRVHPVEHPPQDYPGC